MEAKRIVDRGILGRVTFVRCFWNQDYSALRSAPAPRSIPRSLTGTGGSGPARRQPFDATRFRFWRFFWDFGGGSVTDLMTHWIDVVQWFLNCRRAAEVRATGATYVQDWLEAPDTVVATIAFPEELMVVYEGNMDLRPPRLRHRVSGGQGHDGDQSHRLCRLRGGTKPLESVTLPKPVLRFARSDDSSRAERVDGTGTMDNVRNWLDCVRSRRTPNADLRSGVESAATAHLVNQSIREHRTVRMAS